MITTLGRGIIKKKLLKNDDLLFLPADIFIQLILCSDYVFHYFFTMYTLSRGRSACLPHFLQNDKHYNPNIRRAEDWWEEIVYFFEYKQIKRFTTAQFEKKVSKLCRSLYLRM